MILARVTGEVVATIRHPICDSRRMLVVERIRADGQPAGGYLVAFDAVDAGIGQTVLVIDEGNSARQVLQRPDAPVRSVIVGIVDHATLEGGAEG